MYELDCFFIFIMGFILLLLASAILTSEEIVIEGNVDSIVVNGDGSYTLLMDLGDEYTIVFPESWSYINLKNQSSLIIRCYDIDYFWFDDGVITACEIISVDDNQVEGGFE